MILISFRKKNLKLGGIILVFLIFATFNLCFLHFFDSSLKQNRAISVPNIQATSIDINENNFIDLQDKIVTWKEVLTDYSNLSTFDKVISYPENALVKVRGDNKMEFILKRNSIELSSQVRELISKFNVEIYQEIPYFNASTIYISIEDIDEFMLESKAISGIAFVEPNFYMEIDFEPNDEHYADYQWDLPLIGMESAWEYEIGSHDVIVAVVDTGIDYTHPDLSANYLSLGYDWVNNDNDPNDDHYHGTHCAGTIAAIINNAIGIAGMANVSVFAEKSFNSIGSGSTSDSSSAIMHAVDMGADIISCSWGGTSYSSTLVEAIEYATENDVIVIAAAGNSNSNSLHYPAAYPGVVAVSATDENDIKASFSNYGDWIDVAAPGVDIASTVPYEIKGGYYMLASGTSMAAPHVSGLAALLMSAFPTYSANQIETLIYDSALDLGDAGFDDYYGHGRIDATNIFGPDTTPPSYSNLIESADPLLLGNTETIMIDVFDPSGVKQVLIEFEGLNQSMTKIDGNTWQYNSWTPSNTGIFPYNIFMEDNTNLWNNLSNSIEVKEDTEPPEYSNLVESSDPLELGNTEIISISITDLSGVNQVKIEFDGLNHSMTNIGGDIWRYDSWTPSYTGIYPYTIYMEDFYDHWNSVSNSIRVIDSTPPIGIILTNDTGPLELGNSRIIKIKATDASGINQVRVEYEGSIGYMTLLGGDVWQFKDFIPSYIGICNYTIHIEDNNNNWATVSDTIEVRDTTAPYAPTLIIYPNGDVNDKIAFDWEDGNDPSGILYYKLIIDNESYPLNTPGNIFEIQIENVGVESSYYELEEPLALGTYYFFIYQIDGAGHQSASATGKFTVVSPTRENQVAFKLTPMVFWLFILGIVAGVPTYVVTKKIKNGKSKLNNDNIQIKYLQDEVKELKNKKKRAQKAAELAVKYGNYGKAAELYEECEEISNQIFKKGNISEAETTKYYANMKSKASQAQEQRVSFVTFAINEILTRYFDNITVKYYNYPQIYRNGQKSLNGWISNDTKFLQHRLTNPQNGLELVRELGYYPENVSNITAIQFVYTNDLSFNSIIEICQELQNPNVLMFILGFSWPSIFQDRHVFTPPEDANIMYKENIRIIDYILFANLIGLEGENRELFFKTIRTHLKSISH
ncbi:MAG: S8 family serine peptidase [Promethearchaeota archaeon]